MFTYLYLKMLMHHVYLLISEDVKHHVYLLISEDVKHHVHLLISEDVNAPCLPTYI